MVPPGSPVADEAPADKQVEDAPGSPVAAQGGPVIGSPVADEAPADKQVGVASAGSFVESVDADTTVH